MTGPNPFFGLSCWPGARAGVTVVEVAPGRSALSVYLDPMDLVLNVPPFPGGDRFMVRFLRELGQSASGLADQLNATVAQQADRDQAAAGWFADDHRQDGDR